jgi:hypothetical protein
MLHWCAHPASHSEAPLTTTTWHSPLPAPQMDALSLCHGALAGSWTPELPVGGQFNIHALAVGVVCRLRLLLLLLLPLLLLPWSQN